MSRRLLLAALLALVATSACASIQTGASQDQLRKRASFDLDCPTGQLEIVEIDERTRGVRGCGNRSTYLEQCNPCQNGYHACDCTWVMNTDTERESSER